MKYMLLIYGDANRLSETERKDCYVESTQLAHQLHSSQHHSGQSRCTPHVMATSVRVRDGNRLVTDGPFAETREQLGGYFLIEAQNDLDESDRRRGKDPHRPAKAPIEVRPVIEIPNLPEEIARRRSAKGSLHVLSFDDQAERGGESFVRRFFGRFPRLRKHDPLWRSSRKVSGRPNGSVMTLTFEIEGQEFVALDGGPAFHIF